MVRPRPGGFCLTLSLCVVSGAAFFNCLLACASSFMCELRMMEVLSSGTSSDEENEEHTVGTFSLEVVEQGWTGSLRG